MSTQWGPEGYFYPIQVAQYGLSHYSKYVLENRPQRSTYGTTSDHIPAVSSIYNLIKMFYLSLPMFEHRNHLWILGHWPRIFLPFSMPKVGSMSERGRRGIATIILDVCVDLSYFILSTLLTQAFLNKDHH